MNNSLIVEVDGKGKIGHHGSGSGQSLRILQTFKISLV